MFHIPFPNVFTFFPYRTPIPTPTVTPTPTPTPEPWYTATPRPTVEISPIEKKILTFSFRLGNDFNFIGFVYDTDGNEVADLFEVYEIGFDPKGFFYIIDLYRVESDADENQTIDEEEVLYQK